MRLPLRFSKALLRNLFYGKGVEPMSGEELLAYWWTLQWKRVTVMYPARSNRYMDIKKVFNVTAEGEAGLNEKIFLRDWLNIWNHDDRMYDIMLKVTQWLDYVNDMKGYGKIEFWADPWTILQKEEDDCDGFAVLMAYLGWASGIPRFRLKVVGGDVIIKGQENEGNNGHAYCIYLKQEDNRWYTLEGSFYSAEARKRFRDGVPHSEAKRYDKFWWTTTDKISWSQKDLVIHRGVMA